MLSFVRVAILFCESYFRLICVLFAVEKRRQSNSYDRKHLESFPEKPVMASNQRYEPVCKSFVHLFVVRSISQLA